MKNNACIIIDDIFYEVGAPLIVHKIQK